MRVYRIRVWKKWKALITVDYVHEADARAARDYLLKQIEKLGYKVHVQLIKASVKTVEKFNAEDFDSMFEELKQEGG